MPLEPGKSQEVISRNIEELIKAGHSRAQAAAIAYREAGEAQDDDTGQTFKIYDGEAGSARKYDLNGWAEVKGNPISKVGVFDYLGSDISPELVPDQIYRVYRPAEELSDPETIESFKLLPWTDEHAMLGFEEDGMMPAEKKGIQGVVGEDVYFEDGYLKANLKIFSTKLANLIDSGKKELSIGYRCLYDMVSGVYDGMRYDAIQRKIRGNHLATVEEGRSGHDVAVLDHFRVTFDSKEIQMPEENEIKAEEMSMSELTAVVRELMEAVAALKKPQGDESELSEKAAEEGDTKDEEGEYKKFVNKSEIEDKDLDEQKSEKIEDEDLTEEEEMSQDDKPGDMSKPADKKGMDSAMRKVFHEISRRDDLYNRLSQHVGAFDHKSKTFDEVAKYGVQKLKLKCTPGHEAAFLEGFLVAAKVNSVSVVAKDSKVKSESIDAFLKGGE